MGYKRAGFDVIGNVEIDSKINGVYLKNNHPKLNYCEDLRIFNQREDLPDELYSLDILDGSPPCTSFSTVGIREAGWGKKKKFREGQSVQTLDDLFFVFLDTVEKLSPKIVVAENVVGITTGKARGYVNLIIRRFKELGYDVQLFSLNSAYMDVPQARHRIFFIANNQGYKKLKLDFSFDPIVFGKIKTEHGIRIDGGINKALLDSAVESDRNLEDVKKRLSGKEGSGFSQIIIHDEQVAPCITSGGSFYRFSDRTKCTGEDFRNMQTFPQDYDFLGQNIQYICGMSVPPNMMANIAMEIYHQWLS